jgi:Tol biopolymer transport system component
MPLSAGIRIGTYEITTVLGVGGMGEVYRARDARLGRDVAIKVLPAAFISDPERVARFEREAKTLATLNHPNIAQIYGVEEQDGVRALVMELVEGATLAEHLAGRAIGIDEALPIARQIGEALEAAHERGIIHRDLKPANIKLRADGTVKVFDFGLAKALDPAGGVDSASQQAIAHSPTVTSPALTHVGVILGTAAYMSPEQAKGKPVDNRADIWAFGCVVYEMLTGRQPFSGETVTEMLARIIEREPDWDSLRPETPSAVRRVLQRCLQKNPAKRYRHIADVIPDLEYAASDTSDLEARWNRKQSRGREAAAWLVAVLFAVIAGILWTRSGTATTARVTSFELQAPAGYLFGVAQAAPYPAVSPDGERIVFLAAREGLAPSLWIRAFRDTAAIALPNTDNAHLPFWSPDSRSIAFFKAGRLYRLDINGGSPQLICELPASSGEGGAWGESGIILFGSIVGGIYRVSTSGGTPQTVTSPSGDEQSHHWPVWLPGERRFLYRTGQGSVFLASLEGATRQKVVDANSRVEYVEPGLLLYVRGSSLVAQPFDASRGELHGEASVLVESLRLGNIAGRAAFSAASDTIVSRPATFDITFKWDVYDEHGKPIQSLPLKALRSFSLSPDGSQVAVHSHELGAGGGELSLVQLDRGAVTRLNRAPFHDDFPVWSPDGRRLAITDFTGIMIIRADSTGDRDVLLGNDTARPTDWVPGQDWIIYHTFSPETENDIWALPLAGDRKPLVLIQTRFSERNGVVSPDGEWLAFTSNESGRAEVYVQKFPGGGRKLAVSMAGGSHARWDPHGRFLYYWAPDDRVMRVPLDLRRPTLQPGSATPVLTLKNTGSQFGTGNDRSPYIVGPKGLGFIAAQGEGAPLDPRLTVVLNWRRLLERRARGE